MAIVWSLQTKFGYFNPTQLVYYYGTSFALFPKMVNLPSVSEWLKSGNPELIPLFGMLLGGVNICINMHQP